MSWKLIRVRSVGGRRKVLAIVLSALALVGLAGWLGFGSGLFSVDRVEIRGATFTDTDKVSRAAAVPDGVSLLSVDTDDVAERVAKLPEVEVVTVSRDWPHTIVVDITERSADLAVPVDGGFILVDRSGVAFRTVDEAPDDTFRVALDDPGRHDPATVAVLTVLSSLTSHLQDLLVEVDAQAPTRITLILSDERTIFWGDASRSDRKAEVATALLGMSEQHFDVSAPDVPTVS
ncbi:MAG TPA: FtsQ-type POTRA domain-containing protein [Candidatus Stackebrandtia excrementipullorum]|nr:FtsQ-type POTRA domain-containing protein [Candidatus Stackebrandtia excrementipullorum]